MVRGSKPGNTGKSAPQMPEQPDPRDQELERRRRELDASLASRRTEEQASEQAAKSSSVSGFGNALKLSSEFIAGVVVGAGLGWLIDSWAGTSPWGLIVFLLLGFGAGVLNVMRSAGLVANAGIRQPDETGKPE
ncbi:MULTISPECIES: AtpZ/AtpI family protein [Mesorhizobium]|uniref:ATP F0F1 synthase subunit I n=1 Tax=Mesorhizobium denitrificans TaxID=2294114 RepID=A0A371XI50_9HYPH|nr:MULTISPECIES: AtpZ/AtpI family protein [Mesorhizobium]RFC68893.1 ATP F0F1 synthase subunit I [Mesorhizobium denitrificans]